MGTRQTRVTGGISILSILGLIFVTLKLTGHIDWSWWWVTSPFWIPPALAVVLYIIGTLLQALAYLLECWLKGK